MPRLPHPREEEHHLERTRRHVFVAHVVSVVPEEVDGGEVAVEVVEARCQVGRGSLGVVPHLDPISVP